MIEGDLTFTEIMGLSTDQQSMTPIGRFLSEFFSRLDESQVSYCILRGYEGLPDRVRHDLDLLLHRKHQAVFRQILKEVSLSQTWQLAKRVRRFSFQSWYLILDQDDAFFSLKIDIWTQISWKAVEYAGTEAILDARRRYNNFWIASPGSEAAVSLLKEYLQIGRVKDKGDGELKKHITQLLDEDSATFITVLELCFGVSVPQFVLDCVKKGDWPKLEAASGKVRRWLITYALWRHPFSQVWNWFLFLSCHFSDKILHPSGFFICLIGPDGSGKTTVSLRLQREMAPLFAGIRYYHGHLHVLPELKQYRAFVSQAFFKNRQHLPSDGTADNSENPQSLGLFRALVYVFYYFLDYLLGHFVIRWTKGHGELVLFDRYFYDYLIQPAFRRVPHKLLWALERLLPKPDLLIWLSCDPEVVHSRKPELSVAEIRRQMSACQEILGRINKACVVETDTQPAKTVQRIYRTAIDQMAGKTR